MAHACAGSCYLPPLRYSEDLDYVRATHGPIGPILDAIREIADRLEMDTNTDVGPFPKARLRAAFESGAGRMRVKIKINTYETSSARPHRRAPYSVDSAWWSGAADVLTFQPEDLVATKLRAHFQRRKVRDLFDLWLALTVLELEPAEIVACFSPYRPDGYTAERAGRDSRSISLTQASGQIWSRCCATCQRATTLTTPQHSWLTYFSTSSEPNWNDRPDASLFGSA